MTGSTRRQYHLLTRGSWAEARRISRILRKETIGGALLLLSALLALAWANSPWSDTYHSVGAHVIGPQALHLDLSLTAWAADGLLAIFFFVAGLELKRELVAGDLRDPARAALPVAAALGGVIVPAGFYLLVAAGSDENAVRGWAVPTATDIAFALAVLAVVGSRLPSALRTFLLTLAVVDDLLAIAIIALFYTDDLAMLPASAALLPLIAFRILIRRCPGPGFRIAGPLLVPLALITWALVHASGLHATVAGVLLAFCVPVHRPCADENTGACSQDCEEGTAERLEHRLRPLSAGFAVPVFAFLAAGVDLTGAGGLTQVLTDPTVLGIVVGLVLGKPIGIMAAAWLVARFTRATLDDELAWIDVLGVALLGGVGFTVSLLIGELAFGAGTVRSDRVTVAVLLGSVLAAVLAGIVLRRRHHVHERLQEYESLDLDHDGVPDVYGTPSPTAGEEPSDRS
ncbi:MAG: Na+:H+ antiporter, NhaA family [Actinomycetota bacterium]|nr:Na+:H+ antiporter, NhaA family [Actinomycetota bacterium]